MTTEYVSGGCPIVVGPVAYEEAFAPGMATPFRSHWYESGGVPDAATLKSAG
jgi:hypothetical protein